MIMCLWGGGGGGEAADVRTHVVLCVRIFTIVNNRNCHGQGVPSQPTMCSELVSCLNKIAVSICVRDNFLNLCFNAAVVGNMYGY